MMEFEFVSPSITKSERNEMIKRFCSEKEDLTNPADESLGEQIVQNLESFGVKATFHSIECGPVITRINVRPAIGTKASSIISLKDDLAIALMTKQLSCSINSDLGCVAIDIPVKNRKNVLPGNVNADCSQMELPLEIGVGITGESVAIDLAEAPHLLIAGQTGSGKSVCINSIIASLLKHKSEHEYQLMLIDPKQGVELGTFEKLPNVIDNTVLVNAEECIDKLNWLIDEMERRYDLLAKTKTKNIKAFNQKQPIQKQMKYIVCIVDEFADLMLSNGKELTNCVQRLSQKSRAAGIHIILATQRPSTKVVTGDLKANLAATFAFKVRTDIDSRTILGEGGAEDLLGKGDMLVETANGSDTRRVHGVYYSDEVLEGMVNFIAQKARKRIVAQNKEHLSELIREAIQKLGNECDLNFINVSNVTDMSEMFKDSEFNGDISKWDVSNVTNMSEMFCNSQFNGDISKWDVSNVTNMEGMFNESQFNGDISEWDVSNVTNMSDLFGSWSDDEDDSWSDDEGDSYSSSRFNGDISRWNVSKITNETDEHSLIFLSKFHTNISIKARDKSHLENLIKQTIELNGYNCDLNFIDVSNVTDMSYLFASWPDDEDDSWSDDEGNSYSNSRFNGDISRWNVSNVTDMSHMFNGSSFNGDISKWDVSNVTNMSGMFEYSQFNGDICKWDVSNVTDMSHMFSGSKFNGNISKWNMSNVTDMSVMFLDSKFNGDISKWDVSNVTNMSYMFRNSQFNGDISEWNVSNVTDMSHMFSGSEFNRDISKWNVSNVDDMDWIFSRSKFNGDISKWNVSETDERSLISLSKFFPNISIKARDKEHLESLINQTIVRNGCYCNLNFIDVSNITDMSNLFTSWSDDEGDSYSNSQFNGDISRWNVSNVTNMSEMFNGSSFNGDISKWNVSNVTDMRSMFSGSKFNGDISKWNVSNVTDMSYMFRNSQFTRDISKWNVSNVADMDWIFSDSQFNGDISKWNISKITDEHSLISISKFFPNISIKARDKEHLESLIKQTIVRNGCYCNLNFIDVSNITDMSYMFSGSRFNGDISKWNVSNVTNMSHMFENSQFDGDFSEWNVSKVTDMSYMFRNSQFNRDISEWNVSNVIDMRSMFCEALFNGDISEWNVSNVTDMSDLFRGSQFNGDISEWNVSSVTNTRSIFRGSQFNRDISKWNISNITDGHSLFSISKFRNNISIKVRDKEHLESLIKQTIEIKGHKCNLNFIDTSNITDMSCIFSNSQFNGDISKWNTGNVKNMSGMFECSEFDGDISKWNIGNVTNMKGMFQNCQFNGDISNWNVSNVKDMSWMFCDSKFNGDISKWNVSNVADMDWIFCDSKFNRDISEWNVNNVTNNKNAFDNCPIEKSHKPKFPGEK